MVGVLDFILRVVKVEVVVAWHNERAGKVHRLSVLLKCKPGGHFFSYLNVSHILRSSGNLRIPHSIATPVVTQPGNIVCI